MHFFALFMPLFAPITALYMNSANICRIPFRICAARLCVRRVSTVRAISHATFAQHSLGGHVHTIDHRFRIGKRRMRISGKARARNTQACAHKSTSSYQPTKFLIDMHDRRSNDTRLIDACDSEENDLKISVRAAIS